MPFLCGCVPTGCAGGGEMKERYDVIVVGAGPGGSWAAKHAAEQGVSVLLLEKDSQVGTPVRCAEGVSESDIRRFVDVKDCWIAQVVKGARLIAPDGTAVDSYSNEIGFVLNRKIFDFDLAVMASQAGAEVVTKAYVNGLLLENGTVVGVNLNYMGKELQIHSSVVIGADGVESRVGRWAGLKTWIPPKEMASCAQVTLTNIKIDPDIVEFYFGRDIAPGGYLWIFPKGDSTANVGLGISGEIPNGKTPFFYLEKFIEKKFPNASQLYTMAGGVPVVSTLKQIVSNGLMLVGDAARQANPVTGGGIINAMIAGSIAGRVAGQAVLAGDVSSKRLSAYSKEWHETLGKKNEISYKIKKVVNRFSDKDFNRIAKILMKLPPEKRTMFRIFKAALLKHPKLILEAAKIFV